VWVIIRFFGGGEKGPFEPPRDYADAGVPVASPTQIRDRAAHESVTLPDPDIGHSLCNATACTGTDPLTSHADSRDPLGCHPHPIPRSDP
jgi:hypothetical protein